MDQFEWDLSEEQNSPEVGRGGGDQCCQVNQFEWDLSEEQNSPEVCRVVSLLPGGRKFRKMTQNRSLNLEYSWQTKIWSCGPNFAQNWLKKSRNK